MTQETFERELARRAEDVHGAPFSFEEVRARAYTIRRRRRAVAAGVAAAAVALVIIVPTLLGSSGPRSDAPDPAPPLPTVVPTPREDGTYRLSLDAPSGAAPRVNYLHYSERRLETPDGTVELPSPYDQVLPYGDGWIARNGQEGAQLDAELKVVRTFRVALGFVLSDNGERVAWSELDARGSVVVSASTSDPTDTTRVEVSGREARPVGFMTDGSVAFEATDPGGNFSYGLALPNGDVRDIQGVQILEDTSPTTGGLAAQLDYRNDRACSAIVDNQGGPLWERCGWTLGQVSPDGSRVLAFRSPVGGPLPEGVAVLDATDGSVVVEFAGGSVDQAVWEDDDTALATVVDGDRQAVLRLGLDGAVERATAPVPVEPMSVSLWFMSYPRG